MVPFDRDFFRDIVFGMYTLNDKAHRIRHADDVYYRAMSINATLGLSVDVDMIAVAAYAHDAFSWDRSKHHELAAEFVMRNDYLEGCFDQQDLTLIAKACKEHRASYTGEYNSKLSQLIAAADRGEPIFHALVNRSILSGLNDSLEGSLKHLKDKYGTMGYMRKNDYYEEFYKEDLIPLRDKLDLIDGVVSVIKIEKHTHESLAKQELLSAVIPNLVKRKITRVGSVIDAYMLADINFIDMFNAWRGEWDSWEADGGVYHVQVDKGANGYGGIIKIPIALRDFLKGRSLWQEFLDELTPDFTGDGISIGERILIDKSNNPGYWEAINQEYIATLEFVNVEV